MLRLLKRYDLAYHVSPSKGSKPVPGQSIVMSSYPGSLSSQDEYYAIQSEGRELAVAGTPLTIEELGTRGRGHSKDQVILSSQEVFFFFFFLASDFITAVNNHQSLTKPISIN